MGGIGSGRGSRCSNILCTEEVKRVDIRHMKNNKMLSTGRKGTLSWTANGSPSGSVAFVVREDRLELNYRYRVYGDDWESAHQDVYFDFTPCHYGDQRKWFLCPRCNARVAVLYGAGTYFYCRHCYQLPYSSQNLGELNRMIEQKHKLGKRIFEHYENGVGWGKKKGMHATTFNRLHAKYLAYEQAWCNGISTMFGYLD
jgi:hypothetical protein